LAINKEKKILKLAHCGLPMEQKVKKLRKQIPFQKGGTISII
jgi:hypothetical protein